MSIQKWHPWAKKLTSSPFRLCKASCPLIFLLCDSSCPLAVPDCKIKLPKVALPAMALEVVREVLLLFGSLIRLGASAISSAPGGFPFPLADSWVGKSGSGEGRAAA